MCLENKSWKLFQNCNSTLEIKDKFGDMIICYHYFITTFFFNYNIFSLRFKLQRGKTKIGSYFEIADRPLCRKREVRLIGAALQEPSSVVCEVEAYPPPDTFEWTLNSSAGSIKIDPVSAKLLKVDTISALTTQFFS